MTLPSSALAEEVSFRVRPATAPDASSVSVEVNGGFLGNSDDASAISGTLTVDLQPTALNPQTAQITAIDVQLDEAMSFRLKPFLLPAIQASADAGALSLRLEEAGAPGAVTGSSFLQFDNLIGVRGEVDVSVQPEPIDLSEQPPALVDFPEIELDGDRHQLSLATELSTEVLVPIAIPGLDAEISIFIDGELLAEGAVPPATYQWMSNQSVSPFADASSWQRWGVADTQSLPSEIDTIELSASLAGRTLQLDGVRRAAGVRSVGEGAVRLEDGTLEVGALGVVLGSLLEVGESAALAAEGVLRVTAEGAAGHLRLAGKAGELEVLSGQVSGTGEVASLLVGPDAEFLAEAAADPLTISGLLDLQGTFTLPETGIPDGAVLLSYAATQFAEEAVVQLGSVPLVREEPQRFGGHVGSGQFASLTFLDDQAVYGELQASAGDADGDGQVSFADFLRLSAAFGGPGDWTQGDFDGNGEVDFTDFLALSAEFGNSPAAVPEPAAAWSAAWLLAGLMTSLRRKKKGAFDVSLRVTS